jgi:alcohol dehydrogenase class IV
MRFEFATAVKIVFGNDTLREALSAAETLGSRILLVTGTGKSNVQRFIELIKGKIPSLELLQIPYEPTIDIVDKGVEIARKMNAQVVISFGGGSAIDAGKAIAGLALNDGSTLDYLEVIGRGKPLQKRGLPMIAVPTTAGTGSEVTRNAVLAVPLKKVKVSLRSPYLLPVLAVVDPELTYSMPPEVTASTGMDALSQVIEPFVSIRANPLVDQFCREGMKRIGRSLRTAYLNSLDSQAREDMSFASLMGGLSLANAGLGAVHGFAAPMGGMFSVPHGTICARLLGPVIRCNWQVLMQDFPQHPSVEKYREAAELTAGVSIREFPDWVEGLCEEIKIPRLRDLGIRSDRFQEIAQKAALASSMQANPVKLEEKVLIQILQQAL